METAVVLCVSNRYVRNNSLAFWRAKKKESAARAHRSGVRDVLQLLRKLRGDGGEDDLGEICTLLEFEGGGSERPFEYFIEALRQ